MYIGMIEIRSLKILLKSFHENHIDLLKNNTVITEYSQKHWQKIQMAQQL